MEDLPLLGSLDMARFVARGFLRFDGVVPADINDQFLAIPGGYPVAAALSFTLMAAILVMVFLYVRRFGTEELV